MRVAIYARLSKDRDNSTSIERQVEACRRVCEARGYEVAHVSDIDVDVSGGKLSRPGLDEVRRLFPELDVVIFYRIDRLSRSLRDFIQLVDEADQHGVALVSATEPFDLTTPIGRAMIQIISVFAELERATVGIRVAASIQHLRQVGRISGGRVPYGYRAERAPDGAGYVRVVDEEQAAIANEMAAAVLAGQSRLSISRDLNARHVKTAQGGTHWRPETVGDVLRNPALWGAVVHRGQILRGDDGLPILTEAVMDRATWDAVQAALDARSGHSERMEARRSGLLSGILVCASCGANLGQGHSRTYSVYKCPTRSRGGECVGVSVRASLVAEYVTSRFLAKYGSWSMSGIDHTAPAAEDHEDEVAEELSAIDTALSDLERDRYDLGLFSDEAGRSRYAALHKRLSERREAVVAALRASESSVEPATDTARAPSILISDWWTSDDATLEEQRAMLKGLLGHVAVRKGVRGRHGLDASRLSFEKGLT